ncbi:unnamed protein product [Hanseniaspora opuntiae]
MLRSTLNIFRHRFIKNKIRVTKASYSSNVSYPLPITLKQEIQILSLISQDSNNPLDNIGKIIEQVRPSNIILNNNVCESTTLYLLKSIQTCTDNHIKRKLIEKLNDLVVIYLDKYFKNSKHINSIVGNKTFFINYNIFSQDFIVDIIKTLHTSSIQNDTPSSRKILYFTIPMLYKYYYQTYTWNVNYQGYDGRQSKGLYLKLPITNTIDELKQLVSVHRREADFDLITYNFKYNNFDGVGSGEQIIPNIQYEVVKQLPKVEMARKQFVPMKLNENMDDTYLDFADLSTRIKLNAKFTTFVTMQIMQCETSAKRFLTYLLNEKKKSEITKNDIYLVLAQLSHHLDKIVNMDGHQYRHKENSEINYLLNDVKINDFPNLSFVLKNSKELVKDYILKQLHYKVLKRKMLNDLKINKYLPYMYDESHLLEHGAIIKSRGEFDIIRLPYRHLTKSQRTSTNQYKTEQEIYLDYYPRIYVSVVKRDGEFVYRYNTSFRSGYKRVYNKRKLVKKNKLKYLDPVQQSNLNYNKIFNPSTKNLALFQENVIVSRNLFMTKILLKFLCVDKDGKLLINLDSPEDVSFLDEVISLMEMFPGDPIFDDVNQQGDLKYNGDKSAMQLQKLQNLLLQFLG